MTHAKDAIAFGVMLAIGFATLATAVQFAYAASAAELPPWAASTAHPTLPPGITSQLTPPDPCRNTGVCLPPGLAARVPPT